MSREMAHQLFIALVLFSNIIGGLFEDILVADGRSLEYYSICSSRSLSLNGSGLREVSAMAYDEAQDRVVLSDAGNDDRARVYTLRLQEGATPQPLLFKGSVPGVLEGLAVSVRLSAVFATDTINRSVVRLPLPSNNATEEGASAEVLHLLPGDTPRGIALLDSQGLLFWTNWKFGRQSIERSRLDGSTRRHLVSSDLYLPNGVAADAATSQLYFLDSDTDGRLRIETCSLGGDHRRPIYTGHHPRAWGLQLAGGNLYWSDGTGVWRLPLQGHKAELVVRRSRRPDSILVLHQEEVCTTYTDVLPDDAPVTKHPLQPSAACDDFCVRGECTENELTGRGCRCPAGFSGERCEISVCHNYCLWGGECDVDGTGEARCRCADGWTGSRCHQRQPRRPAAGSESLPSPVAGARLTEAGGKQQTREDSTAPLAPVDTALQGLCVGELVFGLPPRPLRLLLISLLLLLVLLATALSVLVVRLRRSRAAFRPPAAAYVSASAPRRIVADKKLMPRPARPAPDIEDCCMMTLCETPCIQSAGRISSRSHSRSERGSDCEQHALVPDQQDGCNKQTLADLF